MSSSVDQIITNNLEKGLSSDQNDQTTIVGRHIAEIVRTLTGAHGFPSREDGTALVAGDFAHGSADRVWGFNIVTVDNGAHTITVGPGVLLASSGGAASGPLDSTYRIGLSLVNQVIAMPAADGDGNLLLHLLQATVSETIVQANRNILTDPAPRTFTVTLSDKQRLHGVTLSFVAGGMSALPAPAADNVALYGVPVAPITGDVDISALIAMRTSPHDFNQPFATAGTVGSATGLVTSHALSVKDGTMLANLRLAANVHGFNALAYTPNDLAIASDLDFDLNTILSPSDAITDKRWHYLYMFKSPIGGGRISNAYALAAGRSLAHNCGLVLSSVKPHFYSRGNSAAIALPKPFLATNLAIDDAVCVGAVRGATAAVLRGGEAASGGATIISPLPVAFSIGSTVAQFQTIDLAAENNAALANEDMYPVALARRLRIAIRVSQIAAPAVTAGLTKITAFATGVFPAFSDAFINPSILGDQVILEAPARLIAGNIRLQFTTYNTTGTAAGQVDTHIGNTQFECLILGYHL